MVLLDNIVFYTLITTYFAIIYFLLKSNQVNRFKIYINDIIIFINKNNIEKVKKYKNEILNVTRKDRLYNVEFNKYIYIYNDLISICYTMLLFLRLYNNINRDMDNKFRSIKNIIKFNSDREYEYYINMMAYEIYRMKSFEQSISISNIIEVIDRILKIEDKKTRNSEIYNMFILLNKYNTFNMDQNKFNEYILFLERIKKEI